jgi:hypothetical protein
MISSCGGPPDYNHMILLPCRSCIHTVHVVWVCGRNGFSGLRGVQTPFAHL